MDMTTRETSRKAWQELCDSRQLKGKQAKVLEHLIGMGQATSGEVIANMREANVNLYRARFTELQARGLIVEVGTRPCKISGRMALVWEFSGRTKALVPKGRNAGSKELRELVTRAVSLLKSTEPPAAAVSQWFASARHAGIRV